MRHPRSCAPLPMCSSMGQVGKLRHGSPPGAPFTLPSIPSRCCAHPHPHHGPEPPLSPTITTKPSELRRPMAAANKGECCVPPLPSPPRGCGALLLLWDPLPLGVLPRGCVTSCSVTPLAAPRGDARAQSITVGGLRPLWGSPSPKTPWKGQTPCAGAAPCLGTPCRRAALGAGQLWMRCGSALCVVLMEQGVWHCPVPTHGLVGLPAAPEPRRGPNSPGWLCSAPCHCWSRAVLKLSCQVYPCPHAPLCAPSVRRYIGNSQLCVEGGLRRGSPSPPRPPSAPPPAQRSLPTPPVPSY